MSPSRLASNLGGWAVATYEEPSVATHETVVMGCGDPTFTAAGLRVDGEVDYEVAWERA